MSDSLPNQQRGVDAGESGAVPIFDGQAICARLDAWAEQQNRIEALLRQLLAPGQMTVTYNSEIGEFPAGTKKVSFGG
jgi:hypothetical protein